MSIEGVDYSFSRPTPAQLAKAGKRFACRYIGTPGSGKNLTRSEADALRAAGIALVANYEGGRAGWMSGGRSAGIAAAKAAHADAVSCGMPPDRPIIFSADYNATFDQYKTQIRPCLEGAASVLGAGRVGVYGGVFQVTWAHQDGVAPWVWQTYAWSYGQWYKHANIQQYRNGVALGSGIVDLDRAMTADYGQWGTLTREDLSVMDDATKTYLDKQFDTIRDRVDRAVQRVGGRNNSVYNDKNEDFQGLTMAEDVLAAVKAGVPVTLNLDGTPEQLDMFAKLTAGHLASMGLELEGTSSSAITLKPKATP